MIEFDSLGLVSKLQTRKRGRSYLDIVLDDIRSLVSCLNLLLSSHIKRVGNVIAHLMVRFDQRVSRFKIFCSDILACILTLAEIDSTAYA